MNFKKHTIKLLKPYLSFIRSLIAKFNYNISPINNLCWVDKYALLKDIEVKVIIDVGANKGNISRKYKEMFPAARVISIEPIKDLCENIKNNFDWAEVYNVAICDICSKKVFNINSSRDTSSLLETDLNSIPESYISLQNVVDKINVDGITLDKLTSDLEIEKINILKLDIQGGELNALKGARRLLENNKIDLIYTESFFLPFYKDMELFGDIASFLFKFGYKFHSLYNEVNSGHSGRLQWCDAIFISPKLSKCSKKILVQSMTNY